MGIKPTGIQCGMLEPLPLGQRLNPANGNLMEEFEVDFLENGPDMEFSKLLIASYKAALSDQQTAIKYLHLGLLR